MVNPANLVDVFAQNNANGKNNDPQQSGKNMQFTMDQHQSRNHSMNNGTTKFDPSPSFLPLSNSPAAIVTSQSESNFDTINPGQWNNHGSRSGDFSNVHITSKINSTRNGVGSMTNISAIPSTAASDGSSSSSDGGGMVMFKKPARLTALESKSNKSSTTNKLIRNKTATFVRKHE